MKHFVKKLACAATAAVMAVSMTAISASAVVGDLNDSGKMNSADARFLLRYSAKLETLDDAHLETADLNYDGKVNSGDARILLRAAAKLEDLEHYNNYYFEMYDNDGVGGSFGRLDGTIFVEASMTGLNMGMIYEPNGDFIFIDHEGKRFAVLTVEDQKSLELLMKSQGGSDDLNFKEMLSAALETLPEMPTPLALLDEGYVKSEGEWNGTAAQVYTKGNTSYYYQGKALLGIGTGSTTATYRNFTESPAPYIYAYRNNGYAEVDFMELMMTMAGI